MVTQCGKVSIDTKREVLESERRKANKRRADWVVGTAKGTAGV